MKVNFSTEVKDVITKSKGIALKYQNDFIGTEHLLLALIEQKQSINFQSYLSQIDITDVSNKLLKKGKNKTEENNLHLTRQADRALKTTFLEAKLFSDVQVNLTHLLLCILRNVNDKVTEYLNKHSVYYDGVKEVYKELKNIPEVKKTYHVLDFKDYTIEFKKQNEDENNLVHFETAESAFEALEKLTKTDLALLKLHSLDYDEITVIANCTNIEHLVITNSKLKNIEFLKSLKILKELTLYNCEIHDITVLSKLQNLIDLNISHNKVDSIKALSGLKKLKRLNISSNNIIDITPLKKLISNKIFLLLGDNKIREIDEAIILSFFSDQLEFSLKDIQELKHHYVKRQKYQEAAILRDAEKALEKDYKINDLDKIKINNIYIEAALLNLPLQSPPLEIIREGMNDIKAFFSQINKDQAKKYLYEGKLLIIGEGGTGKTSFARKMENIESLLPSDDETTFNIDIKKIQYNIKDKHSSKMHINMWDFGGQKIYRGTHQLFFSNKCLYVLLDDNREEKTDFSYWLNTVEQLGGNESSLIIVLNQKHGRKNFDFDESGYKSQFGKIIKDIISLDLSENDEKTEFLTEIVKLRFRDLPLIGSPLPESWVNIRDELSTINSNFITLEEFISICQSHGINDINTINTLSTYFDNIGVFTHYSDDPLLRERVYLNSNWLVETIYKVIDNEIIDESNGRITGKQVKDIWGNADLHFEVDRLCSLMNKYGLMYRIQNSNEFVVPEKLPKKMPYEKWIYSEELYLNFIYKFKKYTPKGLMSKLIVSLNKYITNQNLVWHRGLNIEYENTYAEIVESYKDSNSFEIKVAGLNKKGLLAIIIEKFDEILVPYKNLTVEKMVQCTCHTCKIDKTPHFFEYSSLLKRREKGIVEIDCEKEYQKMNVLELLEGFEKSKNAMKKIQIFLACSSELQNEREKFEIFINRENKKLIDQNIFLVLNIWEDWIDSMSKTRLQNEYNQVCKSFDIFVSLFSTKVGKYTKEEFEMAFDNFTKTGTPKHIYTYFRNTKTGMSEINPNDFRGLIEFKERLKELGHYHSNYEDSNDLLRLIKSQFDKILLQI